MLPGNIDDIPPFLGFQGNRAKKLTHGHFSIEKENEFANLLFTLTKTLQVHEDNWNETKIPALV